MGVIPVRYLQGWGERACDGDLEIDGLGVTFYRGRQKTPAIRFAWDEVRGVHFDDPGRTKANGMAIFAFGVLGMASRKAFAIITVNAGQGSGYFETPWPIGTWRGVLPQVLHDVPAATGKLFIDGRDPWATPSAQAPPPEDNDPIAGIARLGELRDKGLLTSEEFEAKKKELLKRI